MKVVLLAPTPPPAGGIASWTQRMLNANLKNGWEVSVVDEKVIGSRQVFGSKNKRNIFVEIKRTFNIWKNLKKELKDKDVKVVHSCIPSLTLAMLREYICACITKRYKRKFIIHFRCTVPVTTKGRIGKWILKKICKKSDMIFVLNNQSNEYLKQITKTPIKVIPNFISESEIRESHMIRNTIQKIIYVGGVIESKGAYDMMEVASYFPNIQFLMIGKTDGKIEKTAQLKQIQNIEFVGQKDRKYILDALMDSDVFMFLTYFRGEGFSNSLLEAMAVGLPCIASDWAANKDMIGDFGGEIVSIKDIKGAVTAINNMKSYEIRKKQSESNIIKAKQLYLDKVILDKYVDCYEILLKR